jgi:hypothetical protein
MRTLLTLHLAPAPGHARDIPSRFASTDSDCEVEQGMWYSAYGGLLGVLVLLLDFALFA